MIDQKKLEKNYIVAGSASGTPDIIEVPATPVIPATPASAWYLPITPAGFARIDDATRLRRLPPRHKQNSQNLPNFPAPN